MLRQPKLSVPVTPCYSSVTNSFYVVDDHFAQRLDAKTGKPLWPLYGSGGLWNITYPSQQPSSRQHNPGSKRTR